MRNIFYVIVEETVVFFFFVLSSSLFLKDYEDVIIIYILNKKSIFKIYYVFNLIDFVFYGFGLSMI